MVIYILSLAIVAIVLLSAVFVHLSLGFHREATVDLDLKLHDEIYEDRLHDVIFVS